MISLSLVRLLGLSCGLVCLLFLFRRLRSGVQDWSRTGWLVLFFLLTTLISLFPSLMNFPAEIFYLGEVQGGRVIAATIFSSIFLWIVILSDRSREQGKMLLIERMLRILLVRQSLSDLRPVLEGADIVIIVPSYNEVDNLRELLPRLPQSCCGRSVRVLVVDDGSHDCTSDLVRQSGHCVISHPVNMGGGAALMTGYETVRLLGVPFLVTMDADGQHDPGEIDSLVAPLLNGEADLVIGSRILGAHHRESQLRHWGVLFFSRLINLLMGTKITDCSCGFRALDAKILAKLDLRQNQYYAAETIVLASKIGFRIIERPVTIYRRTSGKSKKGGGFVYGLSFMKVIIKNWWR
ncbi:MAG: glycosyltransferase family 2 protein [Magnetococcales bacterium]|nr:glycosyltransferase family 2 protein [Magnetococcales bacterium]